MKIPNPRVATGFRLISLARIVSEDSQLIAPDESYTYKSSKDS